MYLMVRTGAFVRACTMMDAWGLFLMVRTGYFDFRCTTIDASVYFSWFGQAISCLDKVSEGLSLLYSLARPADKQPW